MICAETSAVHMADKPIKTKDTEVTCGPSTSVLVADQLSHHFLFYLRLYLLGTYKEPKKKELEADTTKNNTEKGGQSKSGKVHKGLQINRVRPRVLFSEGNVLKIYVSFKFFELRSVDSTL